ETGIVHINLEGIKHATDYVCHMIVTEQCTLPMWGAQPLHIHPPEPYSPLGHLTRQSLNWVFIILVLDFSFCSERDSTPKWYGIKWQKGWSVGERVIHTGYQSLVAAVNR
ncbi:hypothetical protein EDD16DRAFT_1428474, partial [Pisolithus croceorrhizus]